MFENHSFTTSNQIVLTVTHTQHPVVNLVVILSSGFFQHRCWAGFLQMQPKGHFALVSPRGWKFQRGPAGQDRWQTSLFVSGQPSASLAGVIYERSRSSSTWLCHKVRAKPAVAGRRRFTRVGSMDRGAFTAPDLCHAHSVAAFLLPLILKALRCSSQLFWPSPPKAGVHFSAHITFLNGSTCLKQGLGGGGWTNVRAEAT